RSRSARAARRPRDARHPPGVSARLCARDASLSSSPGCPRLAVPVRFGLSRTPVTLTRRTVLRAAVAAAAVSALPGCAPQGKKKSKYPAAAQPTMPFERIAYGSDPQQFAELRRPAGTAPVPVVVVVHGGFWLSQYDLGLMLPVCEALTREGFATWN